MPRELHQPHQRPYAAPRRLLAGAHAEPLGQPQVDRKQKAERYGEYGLTQTDGEVFGLRTGGEVRAAGATATGMALRRRPVPARASAAAAPPRLWRRHFLRRNTVSGVTRPSLTTTPPLWPAERTLSTCCARSLDIVQTGESGVTGSERGGSGHVTPPSFLVYI